MADFLLPDATGIEKGGISGLAEDRRILWNERLIDQPGEARSEHWFWIELGKRFGHQHVLQDAYKGPGVFWNKAFRTATPDLTGVSLARLRSQPQRWVCTPVARDDDVEAGTLYLPGSSAFNRPHGQRFPTESGKLEFYSDALEQRFQQVGLSALPMFYPEAEQLMDLARLATDETVGELASPFFSSPVLTKRGRTVDGSSDSLAPGETAQDYDTEPVKGRPPRGLFSFLDPLFPAGAGDVAGASLSTTSRECAQHRRDRR